MKKILISFIIMVTLLSFVSCGEEKTTENDNQDQQLSNIQDNDNENKEEQEEKKVPEHIVSFQKEVYDYTKSKTLSFRIGDPFEVDGEYKARVQGVEENLATGFYITWYRIPYDRGFYITDLELERDLNVIVDLVAASAIVYDNTLDFDTVKTQVKAFAESYENSENGETFEVADYKIFIDASNPAALSLICHYKNFYENENIKVDDYTTVDYNAIKSSEVTEKVKVTIKGTVEADITKDNIFNVFKVKDSDGNLYEMICGFDVNLKDSKEYNFYGELYAINADGLPCISLEYLK